MVKETVKFRVAPVLLDIIGLLVSPIAILITIGFYSEGEIPLIIALIASIILSVFIFISMMYKVEFSRIDADDTVELNWEITPFWKLSNRVIKVEELSREKRTTQGDDNSGGFSEWIIRIEDEIIFRYPDRLYHKIFSFGPMKKLEKMIPEIKSKSN